MNTLKISYNKIMYQIPIRDIIYIERNNRKSSICTSNRMYYSTLTLDELAHHLPGNYCRVHHSYIVDLNRCLSISRKRVILMNQKELPVSRSHWESLRNKTKELKDEIRCSGFADEIEAIRSEVIGAIDAEINLISNIQNKLQEVPVSILEQYLLNLLEQKKAILKESNKTE